MLFQANPHANKSINNWRLFFQALSLSTFAALFSTNALSQEIKLVSAGAGVTELVLALDAADELVAVDSTSYLPEHLATIAKLGYHRMLSAEGIMALSPTLVVGSEVMGPETTLNVLKQAKIEVVKLPSSADEKQLMTNIDTLAQLLKRTDQAIKLKQDLHQRLEGLNKQQQLSQQQAQPKILFMLLQEGRGARVGGKGTAADTIIALSGAKNIANFEGYKSLSQEGILSLQPDVILLSKRSEQSDTQTDEQTAQALLKEMPLLAHTPAGKNGHIQTLAPQALLGGLGISAIGAAETLAATLLKQDQ
ncbi:hemin ABC transporter substrate-binding protein [Shewanella putrefaciens]|nr:hemin ABC transporter substrate-binding protein [Shewanella putrefaciens]